MGAAIHSIWQADLNIDEKCPFSSAFGATKLRRMHANMAGAIKWNLRPPYVRRTHHRTFGGMPRNGFDAGFSLYQSARLSR
jgi:hypothetical protein